MSCVKSWINGRLSYNGENDRYGLLISDFWKNDGFHCGETMEAEVDGEWVPTAIEMSMSGEWYLVGTPYRGDDLEYVNIRIEE
jgi:hypothetical protein